MGIKVYRWEVGIDSFDMVFEKGFIDSCRYFSLPGHSPDEEPAEADLFAIFQYRENFLEEASSQQDPQLVSKRLRAMRQEYPCKPKDGLNHTVMRAFDLLDIITARPGMTASEIRGRIPDGADISLRTVQRDLRALSRALPSLRRDEKDNGWRLDESSSRALRNLDRYAMDSFFPREVWEAASSQEGHIALCLGASPEELQDLKSMLHGKVSVVPVFKCEDLYLYDSILQVVFPCNMNNQERETMNECINERGLELLNLFTLGVHDFWSSKCPNYHIFSNRNDLYSSISKEVERLLKEERKAGRYRACLADAFNVLVGIRCNPGIRTDRLAALCGMSVRKAKRYIDTLRAVGRPLWYDKSYGGWRYGKHTARW
ncbi:hypothetical protein QUW41_09900 [Slackia piriformis]|nr:hypothetical protein [Slackia piriformis]